MNRMGPAEYECRESTQTLRQGLQEFYALNPQITAPDSQPVEFAEILRAHDVGHVIFGCNADMYDELKLLPLFWWTTECTFSTYLTMKDSPVVDVMYADMIQERGSLWLFASILRTLPRLLPELAIIWLKTRNWRKRLPFLDYQHLLDRELDSIRSEYDLFQFMKRPSSSA
jgi:hypothetical protein